MVLVIGCSKDNSNNHHSANNYNQEDKNNYEHENHENNNEVDFENNNESHEYDEHIEHQSGLQIGETGTVEDTYRYEVTLHSVEFIDEIDDIDAEGLDAEAFASVNMAIENIDDESFHIRELFTPGFGPNAESVSLNETIIDYDIDVGLDVLDDEVEPGESVTGYHIFSVPETAEEYMFAIGGPGQQIHTYADWEISEDEIKE